MYQRILGATVLDYDLNSKIRARCPMRNEHGYNSLTGRSAIADVQTLVQGFRQKALASPAHPTVSTITTAESHTVVEAVRETDSTLKSLTAA